MATKYAILRTAKLKSAASMRGSLRHAFRAQNTPNADPELTPENTHFGAATVDEAMAKFRDRLDAVDGKIRSNAVLGIEYLVTGSPERIAEMNRAEQDAYFEDALGWLKERHGDENIVYAGIHRDETSPHLYAYAVPLEEREKDGQPIQKLNARGFLGGSKHVLSEMQTEFAEKIGAKHGLERGVRGSKAKHQSVKRWYEQMGKEPPEKGTITLPKAKTLEKKEEYGRRVGIGVLEQLAPALERAKFVVTAEAERDQALRTAEHATKQIAPFLDLNKEGQKQVGALISKIKADEKAMREAAAQERKERRRQRDRGRNRGGGGR